MVVAIKAQTWWFNQPVLDECEPLLLDIPANSTQGKRAVGGKLFGTQHRLIFVPNRIDARFGGRAVTIPRDDIDSVCKVNATFSFIELFSGALVPRLSILLRDGSQYLFVVNSLDETIDLLNTYLKRSNGGTQRTGNQPLHSQMRISDL